MGRPVVHWEFWSKDTESLAKFYESVFDWQVRHIPDMDYRVVETGGEGGINGGMMTPKGAPCGGLSLYIDVDDLGKYRDRVVKAGGKLLIEEQQVPGVGAFALFEDPDGRPIGLWKRDA